MSLPEESADLGENPLHLLLALSHVMTIFSVLRFSLPRGRVQEPRLFTHHSIHSVHSTGPGTYQGIDQ